MLLIALAAVIVVGAILSARSAPVVHGPAGSAGMAALSSENAGFRRRAVAYVIDGFFIFVIDFLLSFTNRDLMERFLRNLFVAFGYMVLYWTTSGATPGKKAMGVQIVDASTGDVIGPRAAVLRWAGYFISYVPFGFGFLNIIWDPEKRGWHDKIAGTRVVRVAEAPREKRMVLI